MSRCARAEFRPIVAGMERACWAVLGLIGATGCEPPLRELPDGWAGVPDAGSAGLDASLDAEADHPDMNMVPNFLLLDVNATSDTYGQLVSPRHYLGQVSAWFFGHST